MYSFPNLEPVRCSMSSSVASWPAYRFLRRQVKWPVIPISFVHSLLIHTVKGFSIVIEADVFLEFSCFFYDPMDVGNLVSGSSAFSNSVWTSGSSRFTVGVWLGEFWALLCWHVLLLGLFSCVQLCATPEMQPTRLPCPWDSPGKNAGVGCHFLLQCMKVKSESEVTQSCPTLHDPMDCSLPGSSVHGIFQARVLEWGAIAFSALKRKY